MPLFRRPSSETQPIEPALAGEYVPRRRSDEIVTEAQRRAQVTKELQYLLKKDSWYSRTDPHQAVPGDFHDAAYEVYAMFGRQVGSEIITASYVEPEQ